MKKKIVLIMLILLLTTCICFTAIACKPKEKLEKPLTPFSWQKYVDELAVFYVNGMSNEDSDQIHYRIKLDFQYEMEENSKLIVEDTAKYYLDLNVNINLADKSSKLNNGYIKFYQSKPSGDELVFGLSSDNNNFYILIKDEKIKVMNAPMFEIVKGLVFDNSIKTVEEFIAGFAKIIFTDAFSNADKSEYTLVFDIKQIFLQKEARNIVRTLPIEIQLKLYELADTDEYDEFVKKLPHISGKVVHQIENDRIKTVKIIDGKYKGDKSSGVFEMNTETWKTDSILDIEASLGIPINDKTYEEYRIGQLSANGKIDLVGTNNTQFIRYDYSFISNINILELFANGGDLSALPDDNFFHLRISHTCDSEEKSDFCESRIEKSEGAILDIAMSRAQFGTKNIYVSVNIKTALSKEISKVLFNMEADGLSNLLSDYKLITIDPKDYAQNDFGMTDSVKLLMGLLQFPMTNSVSIGYEELKKTLNFKSEAAQVLDVNFYVGENSLDRIVFTTENSLSNICPNQKNIFDETINIVNPTGAIIKKYSNEFLDNAKPMLAWNFFEQTINGDKVIYNMYKDSTLIYGFNKNDEYIFLTSDEAKDLSNCTLKYKYRDLYGNQSAKVEEVHILDVIGLNANKFDENQRVKLVLSYPSQIFGTAILKLMRDTINFDKFLYTTLECDIVIIKGEGIDVFRTDVEEGGDGEQKEKTFYDFGSKYSDAMLDAEARIFTQKGEYKKISVSGSVVGLKDISQTYLLNSGEFDIKYSIYGQEIVKKITVGNPSDNTKYEFVDINETEIVKKVSEAVSIDDFLLKQKVLIIFPSGNTQEITPASDVFIYINGKSIAQEHLNNFWEYSKPFVVFKNIGYYKITFDFFGVIERNFNLKIIENVPSPIESFYLMEDKTIYRDASDPYFTEYAYGFGADIKNSSIGNIPSKGQLLKIVVERGYTDAGSIAWMTADSSMYNIAESKIDQQAFESGITKCDLPILILMPIKLRTKISFAQAGYFRVSIFVGATRYTSKAIFIAPTIPKP